MLIYTKETSMERSVPSCYQCLHQRVSFRGLENTDFTLDSSRYMFQVYLEVCIIYLSLKTTRKM